MKLSKRTLMTIVGGGVLVFAFQNCGRSVGFGTNTGSNGALQSLVALGDGNDVSSGTTSTTTSTTTGTVSGDGTTGTETPPLSTDTPTSTPPTVCVADSDEDRDHEHHSCHSENHSDGASGKHASDARLNFNHEDEHDECSDDNDNHHDVEYVACIITDHGNSLKLGLMTTGLGGVNSVAESVCVTRSECLGDIASSFNVRGAYERGYCEHNPNVRRLTDDEVKALLAP